jgi:hypothetical protein
MRCPYRVWEDGLSPLEVARTELRDVCRAQSATRHGESAVSTQEARLEVVGFVSDSLVAVGQSKLVRHEIAGVATGVVLREDSGLARSADGVVSVFESGIVLDGLLVLESGMRGWLPLEFRTLVDLGEVLELGVVAGDLDARLRLPAATLSCLLSYKYESSPSVMGLAEPEKNGTIFTPRL